MRVDAGLDGGVMPISGVSDHAPNILHGAICIYIFTWNLHGCISCSCNRLHLSTALGVYTECAVSISWVVLTLKLHHLHRGSGKIVGSVSLAIPPAPKQPTSPHVRKHNGHWIASIVFGVSCTSN